MNETKRARYTLEFKMEAVTKCNELGMPLHHVPKPSRTKDFLTLMMEKLKSNTTMI